jgi:hypothetical protein
MFNSQDGKMEESAELTLTMPPQCGHLNENAYVDQFTEQIAQEEERKRLSVAAHENSPPSSFSVRIWGGLIPF